MLAGFLSDFFLFFEIGFLCFVVAMSDLVHGVEAIHGQYKLLTTASGFFLLLKYE